MASTMRVAARLTAEEFLALPEGPPGLKFELLDGELVTMNSALPRHQHVALNLAIALRTWCDAGPDRGLVLLPIDTQLGPDTIMGPDLQWYAAARALPSAGVRPWPVGDLVIEVASPSTARYDARVKLNHYARAGAHEVWLVEPRTGAVRTFRRAADADPCGPLDHERTFAADADLTSPLLPRLSVPVICRRA